MKREAVRRSAHFLDLQDAFRTSSKPVFIMPDKSPATIPSNHSSGASNQPITGNVAAAPMPLPRPNDLKPVDAEDLRNRLEVARIHQKADEAFAAMLAEEEEEQGEMQADERSNKNASNHPFGFRQVLVERNENPGSQVIASGDCSPTSEGVKRSERKDVSHFPDNRRENMPKK